MEALAESGERGELAIVHSDNESLSYTIQNIK